LKLALVGDVMLGRGVAAEIERRRPESFWGDLLPALTGSDLVVANLECALTHHATPWTRWPKVFHFRAPPQAVPVLQAAGVRLVSLANNHVLDYEVEGLLDTLRVLDEAGIAHAGAGKELPQARNPAVVEAAGLRVGMLAFTDNEPGWAAGARRPGTNYLEIRPDPRHLGVVELSANQAREQGAQFVILSLHWGPNMVQRPPAHFRRFARAAVERGVDLVYGHSAHVFQGVGVHAGRPILYDTGDFVDDYAVDEQLRNDQSLLFMADVDDGGVRELRMVPARLHYATVERAAREDLEAICVRMQRLSAELGTPVERVDGGLRVGVRE
jgi:poly-gamma-glutamate capsule biosynthesis protein CapA/YwtB (metallophosphatase superfamily)